MSAYPPPTEILTIYNETVFPSQSPALTSASANSTYLKLSGGTETGLVNFNAGLTTTITTAGLGAVGAPSYTFTGDTNTGIYSSAADTLNFSTGGTNQLSLSSSGVKIGSNGTSMTNFCSGISIIAPGLASGASTPPTAVSFGFTFSSTPKVIASFNTKGGGTSQGLLLTITSITTSQFTYTIYNALGSTSGSLNQEVNWIAFA